MILYNPKFTGTFDSIFKKNWTVLWPCDNFPPGRKRKTTTRKLFKTKTARKTTTRTKLNKIPYNRTTQYQILARNTHRRGKMATQKKILCKYRLRVRKFRKTHGSRRNGCSFGVCAKVARGAHFGRLHHRAAFKTAHGDAETPLW